MRSEEFLLFSRMRSEEFLFLTGGSGGGTVFDSASAACALAFASILGVFDVASLLGSGC